MYIHWWGTSSDTSWPGKEMTLVSGNIYSFTATTSISDFNINDGGSDNSSNPHQTVNLKFPGDNKLGIVGASAGKNSYGNECWNLSWTEFKGLGLTVSADTASCEFLGSLTVTLKVSSATSASYSLNGAEEKSFSDGDKLTIGADGKAGEVYTLKLTAFDGTDTVTETYKYTKTDTPIASSIVFFDNSKFGWTDVYCYAYGTKENAEWPGVKMSVDDKTGFYYITFDSAYKSENIIFTNGLEKTDEGYGKYPAETGLKLKSGECKLLTKELQWIDYGKPDGKPYGFAYTADKTKFATETINVDIDLRNAVSGTYSIDGGSEIAYSGRTTITVGEGKIGNSDVILTLKAMSADGTETTTNLTYTKTFTATKTTYSSASDGHTTDALSGYYATNPDLGLGGYKTITVDGKTNDWDSSLLIAQGVANDDPRVYMPSSIHERSVDDYALYAAWDDDNLYFMWEMANTSAVLGGSDIFSAQKPNGSIWNPGLPVYLVLSVDPAKHAEGTAKELNAKTGTYSMFDSVWDSKLSFDTNIDTFIAFDTANTNGGSAIIPLDTTDGRFDYSSSVVIGRPNNNEGTPNRNGFKIAWDYGTFSKEIIGINGFGGSRYIGDTYESTSAWINFFDVGYKADAGFIYEVAIPLEHLGIDRSYIENNGIGAMLISTFGTSGMNTLPHDPSVLDNANVEYSFDPSTSHEKEDADHITVPLARIGQLLPDSTINYAPLEVNFGTDKAAAQGVNSSVTLKAEAYNGEAPYTYSFEVNGRAINTNGDTAEFTPTEKGVYTLSVTVTDSNGSTVSSEKKFTVGKEVEVVIPSEPVTQPSTEPSVAPTSPSETKPATNPDTSDVTNPSTQVTGEYILLGDADQNGAVNVKDATLIQKHTASLVALTGDALLCSDVDSSSVVNVKDATAIQKFVAGLATGLRIGEMIEK